VATVAQDRTRKVEAVNVTARRGQRARGVLDLSRTKLIDRPALLEGKLLKTSGVIAAEINAFSHRIIVEFDPSLISLDRIKAIIKAENEP